MNLSRIGTLRPKAALCAPPRRWRRWLPGLTLASTLLVALTGTCRLRAEEPAAEDQLKIAFLYNFAKFTAWPAGSFASAGAPLTLCVLGDDTLAGRLDAAMQRRNVGGRPLQVRTLPSPDDAPTCHLLFVPARAGEEGKTAVERVRGHAVLTVGESESFLDQGGILRLVHEGSRLRFEVALDHARAAELGVSSELLSIASSVQGRSRQKGN